MLKYWTVDWVVYHHFKKDFNHTHVATSGGNHREAIDSMV